MVVVELHPKEVFRLIHGSYAVWAVCAIWRSYRHKGKNRLHPFHEHADRSIDDVECRSQSKPRCCCFLRDLAHEHVRFMCRLIHGHIHTTHGFGHCRTGVVGQHHDVLEGMGSGDSAHEIVHFPVPISNAQCDHGICHGIENVFLGNMTNVGCSCEALVEHCVRVVCDELSLGTVCRVRAIAHGPCVCEHAVGPLHGCHGNRGISYVKSHLIHHVRVDLRGEEVEEVAGPGMFQVVDGVPIDVVQHIIWHQVLH
mmetsp:Transcript_51004/g.118817  ORF Transcript_51004/g.118817 Transcript_51004/m.118817 type:complete len:254 (-) Transcript_51004:576-1337(-)